MASPQGPRCSGRFMLASSDDTLGTERFFALRYELPLTSPDRSWCFRLIANHLHLAVFRSMPKSGALCSAGFPPPRPPYDPARPPPWPLPSATLRTLPSPTTGLPRLPEPPFRRAVPTTPADQAGARVDCFPAH